jgi:uncharacterized 2Fe-2S/4Fe-4S cluster protein (DUF4445 family)
VTTNQHGPDDGWIRCVEPDIAPPSLKDNRGDAERLTKGISAALRAENVSIDLSLLKRVPSILREHEYKVRVAVWRGATSWNVIGLLPWSSEESIYGLAIDLGTSTVVLRVLDLMTGVSVDERSFLNPQNDIGLDILTRIHFAAQDGGLRKLQTVLIDKLNDELAHLAKELGPAPESIMGLAVAGNTTMTHLFLGLDPYWMCREPYTPTTNNPPIIKAHELNLALNPLAPVLVLPNTGSYFGGDLIAGILATGMMEQDEISLFVDVGTNAEVVLGKREWLMGCAGAAGPALEGGVASVGMMAGPGVIDKVAIDSHSGEFHIRTIGHKPPVGICGSGLIDLVAQLYLAGMIDERGKFVPDRCGARLREHDDMKHLVLVQPEDSGTGTGLALNQTDIDSLLRSKAAMYTILVTISKMVNLSLKDIRKIYIGGTFGSYIDPESAVTIGMLPDLPLEVYTAHGNTSLAGTTRVLLSAEARDRAYRIRDRITYVELNVNQEFMNLFNAAKFLPHTDKALFPSVRVRENTGIWKEGFH